MGAPTYTMAQQQFEINPNGYELKDLFPKYPTTTEALQSFINTAAPYILSGMPDTSASRSLRRLSKGLNDALENASSLAVGGTTCETIVAAIRTQLTAGAKLLKDPESKQLHIHLASSKHGYAVVITRDDEKMPIAAWHYAATTTHQELMAKEDNPVNWEASAVEDLLLNRLDTTDLPLPKYDVWVYVANQLSDTELGTRVFYAVMSLWGDHVRIVHQAEYRDNRAYWLLRFQESSMS